MRESDLFRPIKNELERERQDKQEVKPLTADERDTVEEKPMTIKDYGLTLRKSIQEKMSESQEYQEDIKLLSELVTPELMTEYQQIMKELKAESKRTEEKPHGQLVDTEDEKISEAIEGWIDNLIENVQNSRDAGFDENDIEELRAQCWMFFEATANVINTKTIEKEVIDFYKNKKIKKGDKKEAKKQKAELAKRLKADYDLDQGEAGILIDLANPQKMEDEDYSAKVLYDTVAKIWDQYNLGRRKGKLAGISAGFLAARAIGSFTPSLFEPMTAGGFNLPVFLEYAGLNFTYDYIDKRTEKELVKVINEVNHEINRRITDSLFFQEFEFLHDKALGEMYSAIERGKAATQEIVKEVVQEFAPVVMGILMSVGFLAKVNPVLGGIAFSGLPVMWQIAKKHNAEMGAIYEREAEESEGAANRIGSIKTGLEAIRTSPDAPEIAEDTVRHMNVKDDISAEAEIKRIGTEQKAGIPIHASAVVAGCVGAALHEAGMVSGGAVLANIFYSWRMAYPVQNVVNLYFNRFPRHVYDINRMEKVLGGYEKRDLPEGEKEKSRRPVSELENLDISIEGLQYKDILQGVNLKIKQGEFVTIAGESGAGKSTLLRNLVGLYRPDAGQVKVGGVETQEIKKYGQESLYSVMSYCNQSPQVFEDMTLRENLLLWSKNEVDDERIRGVLADLHLDKFSDRLDEKVKHFSGGEKVRIGLARTLLKGAKIILLDEPTSSLDSRSATEVRKVLAEIRKKYHDATIICVTHDDALIQNSERVVNIEEINKKSA